MGFCWGPFLPLSPPLAAFDFSTEENQIMRTPTTTTLVTFAAACAASLLLAACGRDSGGKKGHGGADEGPVPVVVTKVSKQDMPIYLDGLGTVQAFNSVTIRAQVSGRLIEVPLKEGDTVRAGQVLARIDPRSYQATLDQAIARRVQDQASLRSAELDLVRFQDLQPEGYVSQQQVDQQRASVDELRAQIKSDDAAIESDRIQVSYCTITAPFDGVVGIRQVDVGNLVSSTDATGIVTITQVKPISVTFTLPEQTLSQFLAGQSQGMEVVAVGRENQLELARGEMMAVDNQIDQSTGTIKLKARFKNEDTRLWPGQFVNVRLLVRTEHDAAAVPSAAVLLGPQGSFVYVVDAQNKAQMRSVVTGSNEGGQVLVSQGLQAGETIVVDGQSRLVPGAAVTIAEAPGTEKAPATAVTPPAPAATSQRSVPNGKTVASKTAAGKTAAGKLVAGDSRASQATHPLTIASARP